jgi:tRNA(fMet)-specific endonuclease VapC
MAAAAVVLDTDVVSFLFNNHSRAVFYEQIIVGKRLTIALTTLAEIEFGIEKRGWGTPRRELMRRFLTRFAIVPPGENTARIWARIKLECEKKGRPIRTADGWIAATALEMNVPLVTNNVSDFETVPGLTILSPVVD